jgi:hypothetical protein
MEELLLLCALAFFAGLIDAIAGGGGLIQVPALFVVLPTATPAMLLGTNKLSSIGGTFSATLRYARALPFEWRPLLIGAVLAAASATLGALAVTHAPAALMRPVVLGLLVGVLAYSIVRPHLGMQGQREKRPSRCGEAAYGAGVGFYDGFFGPGAGAFLMFGLVRWFRRGFLEAAGRARVLNLASNAGALGVFLAGNNVDFTVGVPMAAANVAGGYLGATAALQRGAGFVRRVFLAVVVALIGKLAWDLVHS